MKVIIDAFGGDKAPREIVAGAIESVNRIDDLNVVLTGDETAIKKELKHFDYEGDRIEIIHAPEVIGCDEHPTQAIRTKKDSSIVVALEMLKERDDIDGFVSAGSTGAVLAGSLFKVGRIKGVVRPALSPLMPTLKGGHVLLLDSGANADCRPDYLCQFAQIGSLYVKNMYGIEKPRVALLNNGQEDVKGNELARTTFEMLKKLPINFVGNMEARDILSGDYDVVVADGFSGNIALKSIECGASFVLGNIKFAIKGGGLFTKLGYLMMKKSLGKMREHVDYKSYGAPFLGVCKPVVKAHGASSANSIYVSIMQIKKMCETNYINQLKELFKGEE